MQIVTSNADMNSTDPRDFIRLLMENERRLFAYVRSLMGNCADAEDVLQETSIVLWDKFSEFDPIEGNFIAWSFKVAYFTAQNHRRKKGRSRLVFSEGVMQKIADQTSSMVPELERRHEILMECIEKLNDKDRQLFSFRYELDSSVEKTAEKSGRSVAAVYKALSRLRAALFDCVGRGMALEN